MSLRSRLMSLTSLSAMAAGAAASEAETPPNDPPNPPNEAPAGDPPAEDPPAEPAGDPPAAVSAPAPPAAAAPTPAPAATAGDQVTDVVTAADALAFANQRAEAATAAERMRFGAVLNSDAVLGNPDRVAGMANVPNAIFLLTNSAAGTDAIIAQLKAHPAAGAGRPTIAAATPRIDLTGGNGAAPAIVEGTGAGAGIDTNAMWADVQGVDLTNASPAHGFGGANHQAVEAAVARGVAAAAAGASQH